MSMHDNTNAAEAMRVLAGSFRADMESLAEIERLLPRIRADGEAALRRLMVVAQRDSGQCRRVAGFLLSLYNGERFPFDLTDLRGLDLALFEDCMTVLRMDYMPEREVHRYFENGGDLFERLAKKWRIKDRGPRRRF